MNGVPDIVVCLAEQKPIKTDSVFIKEVINDTCK